MGHDIKTRTATKDIKTAGKSSLPIQQAKAASERIKERAFQGQNETGNVALT